MNNQPSDGMNENNKKRYCMGDFPIFYKKNGWDKKGKEFVLKDNPT